MPHVNPPDEVLRELLNEATTIAVVGASSNVAKPSHAIFKRLVFAGYNVIPVNPRETAVLGRKAWPTLEAIPDKVDIVDVFRRADEAPAIADSAVKIGAKALWLQEGVESEEAARRAEAAGLIVVMDRCIAVTHSRLEIPKKPV